MKVLKRYSRVVALVLLVLALSIVTVQGQSADYPVVISVGSADRVMFAPHTSDLDDGNWIRLSGGMTVDLPSISFVYNGPDIEYKRAGVTLKMYQSLIPDLTYPMDNHQVYKKDQSVTAEFLGSPDFRDEMVSFMLLQVSSLSEIKDVLDDGFSGAILTLLESQVWIQPITLDSTGDGEITFNAPDAGDYILVVAKIDITWPLSDSKIYIYSATIIEVVDYTLSVSVDSTVEKGDTLNVISTLASNPDGAFTHVAAMIKQSEYSANIILETSGSIPSTNLYLNGEIIAEGDLFTDFYTGTLGQSDMDIPLIGDKLGKAFDSNELAFGHTTATQTGTISLSTSSLATGNYVLLVGVWKDFDSRIVGVSETTVWVSPVYVEPDDDDRSPRPTPPPVDDGVTPDDIEDMPPEDAADIIEAVELDVAVEIIEEVELVQAVEIIEAVVIEVAVEIIEAVELDVAVEIIEAVVIEVAAEIIEEITEETAVKILVETDVTTAAEILDSVTEEDVGDILDVAVELAETETLAEVLFEMNEDKSAGSLLASEPESGAAFVEVLAEEDLTKTAEIVEAAIKLRARELDPEAGAALLKSTAEMLEEVTVESLIDLFLTIAGLPDTPSSVADVFEVMDLGKVVEVIDLWASLDGLEEMADVFSYLTKDTLWNIYSGISEASQATIYDYLSEENKAILEPNPAEFIIELTVSPEQILVEEPVTISVTVTNIGEETGEYTVIMKTTLDADSWEFEQSLTIDGGESETAEFKFTPEAEGTYDVEIDDLTESFTVTAPGFTLSPGYVTGILILILIAGTSVYLLYRGGYLSLPGLPKARVTFKRG